MVGEMRASDMERKELGRIQSAEFGMGGYQDAQFGISFSLGGNSWGVSDFRGGWGMKPSPNAKWTEAENTAVIGAACDWVRDILSAANKRHVSDLIGVPIEASFDGLKLSSWRVLTEVL